MTSPKSTRPNLAASQANSDLGTAQLIQFGAVVLIVAGVSLVVMGHEHVIVIWLALAAGLLLTGSGGALFWKGANREAAAKKLAKAEREAARTSSSPKAELPDGPT